MGKKSEEIYQKLCEVIPGGANSPVRAFKEVGGNPLIVEKGIADCIYDVDGRKYIDYCGSWGALIHGHAHPKIVESACNQVRNGSTFGISTEIEEKLARKIIQHMPSIEKIRFVSSGTEATMSVLRLARGYTKKDLIVKFSGNYHGHADFLLVQAGSGVSVLPSSSSSGIPQDIVRQTISLPYNDIDACLKFFSLPEYRNKIAAVILEPIAGNMGVVPAKIEFLKVLREESKKIGALLIFDEVITGFRVSLGGAQLLNHIVPDLTCLGKIIGGGFPAAAFGGKKEIMDSLAPLGSVYQAGTLSGNPVAMHAGFTALELLEQPGFYEELERKTAIITEPVRRLIQEKQIDGCLQQVGSMFTLFFGSKSIDNGEDAKKVDLKKYAQFFHFLLEEGIYIPPSQNEAWFVSHVHTDEHLLKTRDIVLEFLCKIVDQ